MFHVFFLVFFSVLKKWFLILFHSPFKILLFNSFFMYPKLKNVVAVLEKTLEKLYFLFLICGFKKHLRGKIRFVFPLFLNFLFVISSLFASKPQKNQTKHFIFVFVQSLFVSLFSFNIFFFFSSITVVFVHFPFSSFCSSLSAFLPFSFSSFRHSFFFSVSHVSLSVFSPSPFLRILFFCFNSFLFLILLLFFFFFSSPYMFFAQTNSTFSVVNFLKTKWGL